LIRLLLQSSGLRLSLAWPYLIWLLLQTSRLRLSLARPYLIRLLLQPPALRLSNGSCNPRQLCRPSSIRSHRTRIHRLGWSALIGAIELRLVLRRIPLHLHLGRHGGIALLMQYR
jgi:hypothetical protein